MPARQSPWRQYGDLFQTTILIPRQLFDRAKALVARRKAAGDTNFSFSSLLCQALLDYLEAHGG